VLLRFREKIQEMLRRNARELRLKACRLWLKDLNFGAVHDAEVEILRPRKKAGDISMTTSLVNLNQA
jgi:hypothetical protein